MKLGTSYLSASALFHQLSTKYKLSLLEAEYTLSEMYYVFNVPITMKLRQEFDQSLGASHTCMVSSILLPELNDLACTNLSDFTDWCTQLKVDSK